MVPAATGRKPIPPHLKIISGVGEDKFGVARDSSYRPIPKPLNVRREAPPKPADLSDDAAEAWDFIIRHSETADLLKPLDGLALQVFCETWARWKDAVRKRHKQGSLGKNSQGVVVAPWVKIENEAARDIRAWCSEFGISPSAEGKLGRFGEDNAGFNPFA